MEKNATNKELKELITIREVNSNKNKSLGLTFPTVLVKKVDMKAGKYLLNYKKVNGKWELTFVLDSIC